MMQKIDLLLFPQWIMPVKPEGAVFGSHALAVDQGKILDLLPAEEASSKYVSDETLFLPDQVLMPGFVNAHAHSSMTLFRSIADDLPLMDWLYRYIFPLERQWLSEQFVYDGMLLALAEMIRSGITCFYENYYFPETVFKAVDKSGLRASIGGTVLDFETAWAKNVDEGLQKNLDFYRQAQSHPLISASLAPHAPYTLSNESIQKVQVMAKELDLTIQMHVHETLDEIAKSLKTYKIRPLERLDQLEILSPQFMAVHMTHVNDEDISILKKTGVHVIHCPESNLKLASGFCPIFELLQAGVNVALGTDSAVSNNNLDMVSEMRLAALLAKGVTGKATAIPAKQALTVATINGAKALGLDHQIGTLEIGKSADFITMDLYHTSTQPVYYPISTIVYSAEREQITNVWVAGRRLLKDGKLITLDEEKILETAKTWGKKIAPTVTLVGH